MWYLLHFCFSLVTLVNPFFRPVRLIHVFPPGLINKVHSIYISVPWFRFNHVDLALTAERALFHRFQIIFDQILLTFSVAIRTIKINKCNHANTAQELQLFP